MAGRFRFLLLLSILLPIGSAMSYEQAFTKTSVDRVEIRMLPPARLLSASGEGGYFEQSGNLFRALFDYISQNEVAMTVPVEGGINHAEMRFYLGTDAPKDLSDTDTVSLRSVPARQVASIGAKGAYSERNIQNALKTLGSWLESQDRWVAVGEPYSVFWNGPFTPWFMKRFEVHVPVIER